MNNLRVIFMGTPAFVVPVLDALLQSPHEVVAVYTQPPRPAGRGMSLQKSAVHERADSHDIPVFTPRTLKDVAAQDKFKAFDADVAIVAGYGLLLPKAVLEAPKYGCINVHVSLLPRWRGASPVQYAILSGDKETGVTIMQMDVGMDTGPVIEQKKLPITDTSTSASLYLDLFTLGAKTLIPVLDKIETIHAVPQPVEGTHAPMIDKKMGHIDWTQSATQIDRQIRALNPWPGTFANIGKKRVKIIAAKPTAGSGAPGTVLNRAGIVACGADALQLMQIQPDGGKPMDVASAINGNIIKIGDVLS